MTPVRMRIYLHDEAPRIGSGWRTVTVLQGRKWVRMIDEYSKRRAKVRVKEWIDLTMGGRQLPPRKRKRRK